MKPKLADFLYELVLVILMGLMAGTFIRTTMQDHYREPSVAPVPSPDPLESFPDQSKTGKPIAG